jgi:3-phenylpropionate/cinnamic acid dioxygenase small subunit
MTDTLVRSRTMFIGTHYIHSEKSLKLIVTGLYEDEFRKTSKGWLISHRKITLDIPL